MEFNFMFKFALAFWVIAGAFWVLTKYEMKDSKNASVGFLVLLVVGLLFAVVGTNINPDDAYANFDDRRIAEGLCIAQETELYQPPPKKTNTNNAVPQDPYHRTRFVCAETDFWRKAK